MIAIVDTTVVMACLLQETYTVNAQAFFKGIKTDQPSLIPEFGLLECINVLWKYVRFQGMTLPQAQHLIQDMRGLPLATVAADDVFEQGLSIALKHNLAVYDSIYIALAQYSSLPLITLDQKQSTAAQNEGVTLLPITQFT